MDIKFEIKEKIAVLSEHISGWQKEINLVSWNGGIAKYDIRDWDKTHTKMSRGVRLTDEEMEILYEAIQDRLEL